MVVTLLKEHDFNAGSRRNQALHDLLASPVNRGLEGGPTGTAKARVAHVPEPVAIVGFCVQRYPFAAGVSDELRHEGKRLQNGGPSRVVRPTRQHAVISPRLPCEGNEDEVAVHPIGSPRTIQIGHMRHPEIQVFLDCIPFADI